jgi:hypothetical protein
MFESKKPVPCDSTPANKTCNSRGGRGQACTVPGHAAQSSSRLTLWEQRLQPCTARHSLYISVPSFYDGFPQALPQKRVTFSLHFRIRRDHLQHLSSALQSCMEREEVTCCSLY